MSKFNWDAVFGCVIGTVILGIPGGLVGAYIAAKMSK